MRTSAHLLTLLGILAAALAGGCGGHGHEAPYRGALEVPAVFPKSAPDDVLPAEPPPFRTDAFPCSRCHAGGEETPDTAPAMPHAQHLAKGIECGDCHEDVTNPVLPDPEFCAECHPPEKRGGERVLAYFAAVTGEDGEITFPHRWQVKVKSPAHDRHAAAGVECSACHGEPSNGPFARPRSAVLMQRCMTCHTERNVKNTCETCHEEGTRPPHEQIVLHHAEQQRGCLDCHDRANRDVLHLANGTPVPFTESYRLCGQCHGPRLRDWKLGLHGKRTGSWSGAKEYLLCAHCHNPHSPRFEPMTPLPPPVRPEEIR